MRNVMFKMGGLMAAFMLTIGQFAANAPCVSVYYQPVVPEKLKKR